MQFNVLGKAMNHDKAEKYLKIFDKSLNEFEAHLGEKMAELIDQYFDR